MESRLHELVSREVVYDDPLEESLEADVNSNNKEGEEEMKGQSSFHRLMASMKQKANEASRAQTATVESVIEEYLTSNLSNNNLAFWAKYSANGKNCKIKMDNFTSLHFNLPFDVSRSRWPSQMPRDS